MLFKEVHEVLLVRCARGLALEGVSVTREEIGFE